MFSIEVDNLTKIFQNKKSKKEIRETRAVDGISFKLNFGEIFGFLGPNGAGKTTTFRVLAGLYAPTSGQVKVLGEDVTKVGDRIRRYIGFLTENHGNYENLTVYENLKFFGGFFNIPEIDNRIDKVLEQFGIADRKNIQVGKLSKGLKQRAALARVFLPDPQLLFLDEPTSGLDPQAAAEVRHIIKALQSDKRTIIINSHNLEEVQKICDRVAILNKGKIVQMGSAEELGQGLFGTNELRVITKDPIPEEVIAGLRNLDFLTNAQVDGTCLIVRLRNLEEHAPDIVDYLNASGVKVAEVVRVNHSLEDIYLALMADSNKTVEGWA